MKTVDKKTIVAAAADKVGLPNYEVLAVVDAIMMEIKEQVRQGNEVSLRGFGRFYSKESRGGFSNITHKKLETKTVVKFKPSRKYFKYV